MIKLLVYKKSLITIRTVLAPYANTVQKSPAFAAPVGPANLPALSFSSTLRDLLDQDSGQSNVSLIYRLYIKDRSKNYIFDMASILADS